MKVSECCIYQSVYDASTPDWKKSLPIDHSCIVHISSLSGSCYTASLVKNTVDPQKERDARSYVTRQGRATDIISVLDTMTKQLILDDVSWNPRSRSKSSLKEYYLLLLQREREKCVCTSTCVLKICARTVVSVHGQNKGRTTEGRRARNERQEAHLCHSRPPPGALN